MKRAPRAWRRWTPERTKDLQTLWGSPLSTTEIADTLETSTGALYVKAAALGLGKRAPRGRIGRGAKPSRRESDTTGQRRFASYHHEDGEGSRVVLQPHHPAFRAGTTIFPGSVAPPSRLERVLKSGQNSPKLGATVAKGKWQGAPIFMLTLEERDTCPRTCLEWANCYGNNMHWATRVTDDGTLTRRLWGELAALNAKYHGGFLVRLHILGDFFSVEYVEFWRQALIDFPALRIFGFTARLPSDPIGRAVLELMRDEPERFRMRVSGGGYETHCAEVVTRAEDATGILCPAQRDPDRCCASCALCWQSDRTISFVRH